MNNNQFNALCFAIAVLGLQVMCSAQMVSSAVSSAASDIRSSIYNKHIPATTCR